MLRLTHAAYWVSLAGQPKIDDPRCQRKVPILVPKQNLLTAESFRSLCEDMPPGMELATGTEGRP